MKADTPAAYRLLHEGAIALAQVEHNGIRVDTNYLSNAIKRINKTVTRIQDRLQKDEVYRLWRREYPHKFAWNSGRQLGHVLFDVMGLKSKERTSQGWKVDEGVLEQIDLPFVKQYLRMKKLLNTRSTNLKNLESQLVDGFLHSSYHQHRASSYRSSSGRDMESTSEGGEVNFQNLPVRNPEKAELVRKCFISRNEDYCLLEKDFSALEVRISTCYHKDPRMMEYISDDSKCMHRDTAAELFMLKKEDVSELARYVAKNQMVFPQFYGSGWPDCAKALWRGMERLDVKVNDSDVTIRDHLAKKGIRRLGKCSYEDEPGEGTFAAHVRKIERRFWQERFTVYDQWKKDWYNKYLQNGWFDLKTGFRIHGIHRRNVVICVPVQGSAYHGVLWCLIEINKMLRACKLRSMIVGTIHDSIILDVHKDEVQDVMAITDMIMMERLRQEWPWIIVPLKVKSEISPLGKSWHEKQSV